MTMQTETALRLKTIDHVTLVVKDLERSRDFYVHILGLEPVERPAFSFEGSWFQVGKQQVHLILEHDQTCPAGCDYPAALMAHSRINHFAFEVDDVQAATEYLRRRNVPIVAGPKLRPDGAVQVFATDPDGYVVELTSPPRRN